MTDLIHEGIRPVNPLLRDFDSVPYKALPGFWVEPLDDGRFRYWSDRELRSGCGGLLVDAKERDGLTYCPYCDEWFTNKQFIEDEI